jgi:hypothetical protein
MYSQFSLVRFSSVALNTASSKAFVCARNISSVRPQSYASCGLELGRGVGKWREEVGRGAQLPNVSGVDATAQVPSSHWGEMTTLLVAQVTPRQGPSNLPRISLPRLQRLFLNV